MARTRRKITLEEKIAAAQEKVAKTKNQYDTAVDELNQLMKKKDEQKKAELLDAIQASGRTYAEILAFLQEEEQA